MRHFFYIRNFLIQQNISIFTKVIKLLKIEIEKLTSNFSLPNFIASLNKSYNIILIIMHNQIYLLAIKLKRIN
jgi:hypothetical protein